MTFAKAAQFDVLRTIAFGSISTSYANFGTALTFPVRLFKIANNTDGDMLISYDGANDNDFVPAGGFVLYDLDTNRTNDGLFAMTQGTQVRIKYSSVPTEGSVYLTTMYGRGD